MILYLAIMGVLFYWLFLGLIAYGVGVVVRSLYDYLRSRNHE